MAEEKKLIAAVSGEQSNDNRLLQFLLSTDMVGVSALLRGAQPYAIPQCQAIPAAATIEQIPCQLMPPDHMPMPLQPLNIFPSPPTTPTNAYDTYSGNMPCIWELDEAARDDWWHAST